MIIIQFGCTKANLQRKLGHLVLTSRLYGIALNPALIDYVDWSFLYFSTITTQLISSENLRMSVSKNANQESLEIWSF